jgi:hypothetical protein
MAERVRFDRELLLGGSKRNDVLSVEEVIQYGRDSYGDSDYVSLYGLKPREWDARGVRILGRTAVECTRDRLAELIGRDITAIARLAPYSARIIVDPFAGSANTLYWIQRHIPGSEAVGFELDDDVFETTRRNISILGLDLELRHVDYQAGLETLTIGEQQLLIVFVAPPWGDALTEASGLDLSKTSPPISEVVDLLETGFPQQPLLIAIQTYETIDATSLAAVTARLDWAAAETYTINAPGQNHGLILGTMRWTPSAKSLEADR